MVLRWHTHARSSGKESRPKVKMVVVRATLGIMGLLIGIFFGEVGVRFFAPLFPLYLRAFVREEAYQHAQSALRVAKGTRIVLRESEFKKRVDILAVGDSMVFGTLVKGGELFTTQLAQLTGLSVLNLGIPSQGPCVYNHMIKLASDSLSSRPSVVLYSISANDIVEGPCELVSSEGLFTWHEAYRRNLQFRAQWLREWLFQHSASYQLIKVGLHARYYDWLNYSGVAVEYKSLEFFFAPVSYWKPQVDLNEHKVAEGFERTIRKIEQARTLTSSMGAVLLVLLIPFKEQVYGPLLGTQGDLLSSKVYDASYDVLYDRLLNRLESLGVFGIDPRPSFRSSVARGGKLYWTVDGHLTPDGHRVLANTLARRLVPLTGKGAMASSRNPFSSIE